MRRELLNNNKIGKYFLYAIGEILLVIIGILIAVNINESVKNSENSNLRCIYLNELRYTFEYDITDVKENIVAFDTWNPSIHQLHDALRDNELSELDSLNYKFGTVGNFIFFGQRSKTKIEELKYSRTNLIENRDLKNKILLYQDQSISFIRQLEIQYKSIGEDLRRYYTKNFRGYNYGEAFPLDLTFIERDNTYASLVYQRLKANYLLKSHYDELIIKQEEIKDLILQEIEENCES